MFLYIRTINDAPVDNTPINTPANCRLNILSLIGETRTTPFIKSIDGGYLVHSWGGPVGRLPVLREF